MNLNEMKYVAFCDVLGFSKAVQNDFENTKKIYQDLKERIKNWPYTGDISITIYSDSILIISSDLSAVIKAVKEMHWLTLIGGWLIRGGIAYGRHWEEADGQNLFIVSDALVKAVEIEKSVKAPVMKISDEIFLDETWWAHRFASGMLAAPLIFYAEIAFVNPFNPYWFKTAEINIAKQLEEYPKHKEKYEWFLCLIEAIKRDDILIPEDMLQRLLDREIIKPSAKGRA